MLDTFFLNKDSLDPIFQTLPEAEGLVGKGMTGNRHYRDKSALGPMNMRGIVTLSTNLTRAMVGTLTSIKAVLRKGGSLWIECSDGNVVQVGEIGGSTAVFHRCTEFNGSANIMTLSGVRKIAGCNHVNMAVAVAALLHMGGGKFGREVTDQFNDFVKREVFKKELAFAKFHDTLYASIKKLDFDLNKQPIDYNMPEIPSDATNITEILGDVVSEPAKVIEATEPVKKFKTDIEFVNTEFVNGEKNLIPSGKLYIPMDKEVEMVKFGIARGMNILLIGEPGCGKTTLVQALAQEYHRPMVEQVFTADTRKSELFGSREVKSGDTSFDITGVAYAAEKGLWYCATEPNLAQTSIVSALHSLLDQTRAITLPNGKVVKAHADFRFFATMNPAGIGTRPLPEALKSRFGVKVQFPVPTEKVQVEIVMKMSGAPSSLAKKLVALGTRVRRHQPRFTKPIYIRTLIDWATLCHNYDPLTAAKYTVIPEFESEDEQVSVADLIKASPW